MRKLFLLLLLFFIAAPAPALAQNNMDEGRKHFQSGVQFYKEGDFRAALIEFKRAYEAAPNYKVLYNLGQTNLELQDYAQALTSFQKYLTDGGKDIPKDRRQTVDGEIKKLEGRVAKVIIKTNVEGADILVDDVVVGKTPLASPVLVSAGRRKLAIVKAGTGQQSRTVDLAGGDESTVDLEIAAQQTTQTNPNPPVDSGGSNPPPIVISQPPPPTIAAGGGTSTATWIGIVATAALGAGAIVTGSLALVSKSQFDDALNQSPGSSTKIADARDKTRTFALATDILAGTAIAGAVVTVILAITTKGAPKTEEKSVRLDVGPTGAGVSGVF
jgi:hypothetical protein